MQYLLRIVFVLFFLMPASTKPKGRVAKYKIYMLGATVGEFSVTQIEDNGNIYIEAITDVHVKLLFSYQVKYVQHTVYKQGVLQNAHVETYKNGKLNTQVWLKREKDAYRLVNDNDTTMVHDLISYSGSLLYFNEPIGIDKIYNERAAEMRQISAAGEHVFIITDDKDKEINRYYYEEGVLLNAKMKHVLGNLELKRVSLKEIND